MGTTKIRGISTASGWVKIMRTQLAISSGCKAPPDLMYALSSSSHLSYSPVSNADSSFLSGLKLVFNQPVEPAELVAAIANVTEELG